MKSNNVFLYIPNLIGYLRVILYTTAFVGHSLGRWEAFLGLYSLAFLLDEFDGRAARKFNQSSQLGAALDMVSDRCATAGLCLVLSQLYPRYTLGLIVLVALDISSHYYLLYATAILDEASHKVTASGSSNRLLALYYGKKQFMDMLIVGNEVFYLLLYFLYYFKTSWFSWMDGSWNLPLVALLVCLPFYILKQATNVFQLVEAARAIAQVDQAQHEQPEAISRST